jgi:hypothetical protein
MKTDPAFQAKEKERREQRSKLKREVKIKALPAHVSPSAALHQAAKLRHAQEQAAKARPSRPRPRPVPVPRALGSATPASWHPPPPPVLKQQVVAGSGAAARRNPMETKRTTANEHILKMEIIEKKFNDVPDPIMSQGGSNVMHATVGEIEGYRPLYGAKKSSEQEQVPGAKGRGKGEEEEEEGAEEKKGEAYVLSDRDVDDENVLVVSRDEDVMESGAELTEDEKIWKEIFGADAKIPGSDDEDEGGVIGKKTFFFVAAKHSSKLEACSGLYIFTHHFAHV